MLLRQSQTGSLEHHADFLVVHETALDIVISGCDADTSIMNAATCVKAVLLPTHACTFNVC